MVKRSSIGSKITGALLALALIPLTIMTFFLAGYNEQELRQRALDYRLAVADDVNHSVLNLIDRAQSELLTVGHLLSNAELSPDVRVNMATASLGGSRYIEYVALYSADGRFIDGMSATRDTIFPKHRPVRLKTGLRNVIQTQKIATLATQSLPNNARYTPMLVPMYQKDSDVLYGFLWAPIMLQPLSQLVENMSARRFSKQKNRIYLVDEKLKIIAHADTTKLGVSIKGRGPATELGDGGNYLKRDIVYYPEYNMDKIHMLGLVAPLPELGWGTVVEQPAQDVLASVKRTWRTALLIGLAFIFAAVGIGLLLGRRLAAPIKSVANAAAVISKGDFEVRVAVNSNDEIGQMAGAFNQMASDLVTYENQIIDETRIRNDLSRYLSVELVDGIVQKKLEMKLGGERREATMMFADVVGFTSLAEQKDPEFVVSILNELFTLVTEIVFRHGGIIDKFIGDAVMAVFGVPTENADHAKNALLAAEEIQRWMEVGNAKWKNDLGRELQMSIGINSGTVVAGNIGSEKRMEYTVIGDSVNIAARLESLAQPGQILVSEDTARLVGSGFELERVGSQTLTGKEHPSGIFSMVEI